MDVHKKSWTVTVHFKTDLFDYKTVTMAADPLALQQYVRSHFPDHEVSCCYEAGCCGYWIARALERYNWKVFVVNPADVPRTNKQDCPKTDKIDCRHLCAQLQKNNVRGIHIPGEEQEQLRSLFRRRNHLVKQLRTVKSHIKGALLYYGIGVPEPFDNANWSHEMKKWVSELEWKFSSAAEAMRSRLKQLDFLWQEQLHISNELRAYCRKYYNKDYYLLKSIPGIGGITATGIIAELGDFRSFSLKELAALVGLVPGIYQSSDHKISLGLSKGSKRHLRSLLVEATWVAVRQDMVLQAYYCKHAAREPNKAIIKVAHKLLNRIRAVVISGAPYQNGLVK